MDKARVIEVIRQESALIDRAGIVSLYEAAPRRAGLGLDGMIHQAGVRGARLLQEQLGLNGEAPWRPPSTPAAGGGPGGPAGKRGSR